MIIFIKFQFNSYTFKINKYDSILQLKRLIKNRFNININNQALILKNKYLKNDKKVNFYNIKNNEEIILNIKIKGGGPSVSEATVTNDARNKLKQLLENNCTASSSNYLKNKNIRFNAPGCDMNLSQKAKNVATCDIDTISNSVAEVSQITKSDASSGGSDANAKATATSKAGTSIKSEILNKCNAEGIQKQVNENIVINLRPRKNKTIFDTIFYTRPKCNINLAKFASSKNKCYLKVAQDIVSEIAQETSASATAVNPGVNFLIPAMIITAIITVILVIVIIGVYLYIFK